MVTEYCKITGMPDIDAGIFKKAAHIIVSGGLVAIPTETVYGLAGSALMEESAKKIYEAKGRPSDNPLIVHIAEPKEAEKIAKTSDVFYALAERFMPGPLTVILPKRPCIPDSVTAGLPTVAIRCPANSIAQSIIRMSGHPIAAPSANRSGIPSPTKAEHVKVDMDGRIDMIVDGGPCEIGLESTVICLSDKNCTILRPGAVTAEMLSEVCDEVSVARAVMDPAVGGAKPLSPGMKYRHYAPATPIFLVDADDETFTRYIDKTSFGKYGVLTTNDKAGYFQKGTLLLLGNDIREASQRLFMLLRQADEMNLTALYAQLPPPNDECLAFYNRLVRAAGGQIIKP